MVIFQMDTFYSIWWVGCLAVIELDGALCITIATTDREKADLPFFCQLLTNVERLVESVVGRTAMYMVTFCLTLPGNTANITFIQW